MFRIFILALSAVFVFPAFSQQKKWTPPPAKEIAELIGKDNKLAAEKVRGSWGEKGLQTGKQKWIEETTLIVGVLSDKPVAAYKKDGEKIGDLTKLNDNGLHVLAKDVGNFQDFEYELKSDGKVIGGGAVKIEYYPPAPETQKKEDVPEGEIHRHSWNNSKIFPDTEREFEVYIPAQYDGSEPAALLVFQDGLRHSDKNNEGGLRVPIVLDNLIASGDVPVTVGIFINPGRMKDQPADAKPRNRSVEYDSLGDDYVTFLLDEIIPYVVEKHDLKISDDPAKRAIAGGSSGASCAWTAAWERPDQFGKVLGWVGSFTNLRGAHVYPSLIRKTERKPIRVALLGERNDVVNQFGHWPLCNMQMEAALEFSDYDYKYWWGDGFHGSRHAAVMLPEMLRWLWAE